MADQTTKPDFLSEISFSEEGVERIVNKVVGKLDEQEKTRLRLHELAAEAPSELFDDRLRELQESTAWTSAAGFVLDQVVERPDRLSWNEVFRQEHKALKANQ